MSLSNSSDPNPSRSSTSFLSRALRIGIFVAVCLATLLGLFHAEENIRGRRTWNNYRKELEAKGQWTDYKKIIPPAVPDSQNFASIPELAAVLDFSNGSSWSAAVEKARFNDFSVLPNCCWTTNTETDFIECLRAMINTRSKNLPTSRRGGLASDEYAAKYSIPSSQVDAAKQLLNEFTNYNSLFQAIETGIQRPYSRFNVAYDQDNKLTVRLPHLALIKHYCIVFSTRASAELAIGEIDRAFQDVNIAFRIADSVKNEPILVSYLVRCASYRVCLQPVWEGLARHQWSEAQTKALQDRLIQMDLLKDQTAAFKADICFADDFLGYSATHSSEAFASVSQAMFGQQGKPVPADWIIHLAIPRGWFYLQQANFNRLYRERILSCAENSETLIHPDAVTATALQLDKEVENQSPRILNSIFPLPTLLPGAMGTLQRSAQTQTYLNLAAIACALERYRQANGQIPEKLEALAPQFMTKAPQDVINGTPLFYKCTKDGQFILYSVGWNGKDDNGSTDEIPQTLPRKHSFFFGDPAMQKDWVWQYPPKQQAQ